MELYAKVLKDAGKNILLFEGAGSSGTGTKEVPNCRIRTRLRNNTGRLIYLEILSVKCSRKHTPLWAKNLDVAGFIDSCFYVDSPWDKRRNYSEEFSRKTFNGAFEYNKENILKFVNEKLNCSFEDLKVVNEGLRVFDTKNPLCNCSKEGYIPYKEKEYNISILEYIKPIYVAPKGNWADYKLSYEFIKDLAGLKEYIENQSEKEKDLFLNYNYYASLRWDSAGIIRSLEISAKENFIHIGMGLPVLEMTLKELKEYRESYFK